MKKFRVKPYEIEAEQYYFIGNPNPNPEVKQRAVLRDGVPTIQNVIETEIGMVVVHEGDWILKYADGTFGVCSPEDFEDNYEPV